MTAVVTETTWDRPIGRRSPKARTEDTRPTEPVAYRTAHADPACPDIMRARTEVVAGFATLDEALGLSPWACWCAVAPAETIIDPAETTPPAPRPTGPPPDVDDRPPAAGRPMVDWPTQPQINLWRNLTRDLTGADDDGVDRMEDTLRNAGRWTRTYLSAEIDALREDLAARPKPTEALPPGVTFTGGANRYAGDCVICGNNVAAEAGRLGKRHGAWITAHRPGQCPDVAPEEPAPRPAPADLPDVPSGHYAIESHGDNDLMFVRVDRPTTGAYAGRTFVKIIVGGKPDRNLPAGQVPSVLARIVAAGITEAGRLYGQQIGRCCACNRTLTDEESRRLGIGPECRKRGEG